MTSGRRQISIWKGRPVAGYVAIQTKEKSAWDVSRISGRVTDLRSHESRKNKTLLMFQKGTQKKKSMIYVLQLGVHYHKCN